MRGSVSQMIALFIIIVIVWATCFVVGLVVVHLFSVWPKLAKTKNLPSIYGRKESVWFF